MTVTVKMRVTRYSVIDGFLVETPSYENAELEIREACGELWLARGHVQSMPLDKVPEAIQKGGWYADAGSKPVYVDGTWGGRNYPQQFIAADQLQIAYDALTGAAT